MIPIQSLVLNDNLNNEVLLKLILIQLPFRVINYISAKRRGIGAF